jgi:uncharacterized Zn finger protein
LNTLAREAITELEIEVEKSNAKIQVGELPVVWAHSQLNEAIVP